MSCRWLVSALTGIILLCIPYSSHAFDPIGNVTYRQGEPNGGRLQWVAPATGTGGQRIFVTTPDGGLWRTVDGGAHWDTATDRFSSLRMSALAVDAAGMRVYAATWNPVRLLKSTDGGDNFAELTIPQLAFRDDWIDQLLVDPDHPGTVYATTSRGLMRTTDDCASWEVVLPPGTSFVDDVAILSAVLNFRVLATRDGLLYRSSSGNPGSFVEVVLPDPSDGQPPYIGPAGTLLLAPVPGQPQRVFIGYSGADEAMYRSDDYGASAAYWSRNETYVTKRTFVASADGTTFYGGQHAQPYGNTSVNRARLNGLQWDVPFSGPYHADVLGLATTASPAHLYVATDGGLWRWPEGGPDWENLNGDMANLLLYNVFASRTYSDAIVGGTQDNGVIIYRGSHWISASGGDAGDGFLRTDDPNLGAAFEVISGQRLRYIEGDTAIAYVSLDPLPCERPTRGSWALDPTNPLLTCAATGVIHCSDVGGRDPWCIQSADIDAKRLVIVDADHAWATTTDHGVLRTTTGVVGAWQDVSPTPGFHRIYGLDAPELGDPLHALVLASLPGELPRVFETTNGGQSWTPVGIPPIDVIAGIPQWCNIPPCPETPESGGNQPTSFAVTFPGVLQPEGWYVGTMAGLLESADRGATWHDSTTVPHVQVWDLDSYADVVTVGTFGRGVFQRTMELPAPDDHFLAYDPWWWVKNNPAMFVDLWASDLFALSDDVLEEVRLIGSGGRSFQRGDLAHGPLDFRIVPGAAFLVKAAASDGLVLTGPPASPRPIALAPGWNAVGILDPSLRTANDVIADAEAQGIEIEVMLEGGGEGVYSEGKPGEPRADDFDIVPTDGYWMFVCGEGGLWTPGAGSGAASGDEPKTPGAGSMPIACPGGDPDLSGLPHDLFDRLPGEILACIPRQFITAGTDRVEVCNTPPAVLDDRRSDYAICAGQPGSNGCSILVRVTDLAWDGEPMLRFEFDAETTGTATLPDLTTCPINARTMAAPFVAQVDDRVDAPVVHLSIVEWSASGAELIQEGCGSHVDDAIEDLVRDEIERALAAEVDLRLNGLGPVCEPTHPLPDHDSDGTPDCIDGCPSDPNKTDPGVCGCGIVDDSDGDGHAVCGYDCDDGNGSIWARPGEVRALMLDEDSSFVGTTLSWTAPLEPGASFVRYDTLSSPRPHGFIDSTCVESDDGSDTEATCRETPPSGEMLCYLVRAENDCPDGQGSLGIGPDGGERPGRDCP